MATQPRGRLPSSTSLSTIYSREETDTTEVSGRPADQVDGPQLDTEVFFTSGEMSAGTDHLLPAQQSNDDRRQSFRRQHSVAIDSPTNDDAAQASAHLQENTRTSQVTVHVEATRTNQSNFVEGRIAVASPSSFLFVLRRAAENLRFGCNLHLRVLVGGLTPKISSFLISDLIEHNVPLIPISISAEWHQNLSSSLSGGTNVSDRQAITLRRNVQQ